VLPIKDYQGHNIIVAIREGDPEAISKLYDQYSGVLFGFISRIVGNSFIAEGVLQNSFIVIWKSLAMYDPEKERLLTWMLKITMSISINALPETGTISEADTGISDFEYLNNAISLVFFKGLSLEDAAKKLEIPLDVLIPKMKMAFKQLHGGQSL
jgi:RNA polymerase sigma-70 factor (ECF subfamily)